MALFDAYDYQHSGPWFKTATQAKSVIDLFWYLLGTMELGIN